MNTSAPPNPLSTCGRRPSGAACGHAVRAGVVLVFVLAATPAVGEIVLHVAPTGDDGWSGRLAEPAADRGDGPLVSLRAARDRIRARRASGAAAEPVRVVVADGRYTLTETFVLEPADGGSAEAPVVYEAAANARPLFSGGRRITDWKVAADGTWSTHVPEVADGTWRFEQLFVNGRRGVRARSPNRFWHNVTETWEDHAATPPVAQGLRLGREGFEALAAVPPEELPDVFLAIHHKWDQTGRFIGRIDHTDRSVWTSGQPMKPWNRWDTDSLVVLENASSFLDAPGEWFLARNGTLRYRPLPGESPAAAEAFAPVVDTFIRFAGDPAAGRFVEHVTIRGLRFHHGQWLTPPRGYEPQQAVAWVDAMVMADGARDVVLEACDVGHFGRYGVWFRRGCRDCVLRSCHVFDCGAGGVRIGEAAEPPSEAERTGGVRVEDCIIRHGGSIFAPAVGVWIGFSGDNAVVHNEIADFRYTGISAGWRWGYAESSCKRNRIADNHIHHLGYGPLADLGGVYTLGPSEGTVVSGNVIHHVHSRSYGGWGLYPDEGSTGIVFENNLVHDTKDGSFHQHFGRDNVVRNNVFVASAERQIVLTRAEPHRSFTFVNNIVAWRTGPAISGPWEKALTDTGRNCWWRAGGEPVAFLSRPLAEWQAAGHELESVVADPRFVAADRHDYRLAAGSPAVALGFRPVDWSAVGVRGDDAWRLRARSQDALPAEPPPPAPVEIELSFEHDAVAAPPANMKSQTGGDTSTILVTDAVAATGRHSLALAERAGLEAGWAPQVLVTTLVTSGTVHNSFSLRLEPGARLSYEWRDTKASPVLSGASLLIQGGRLWLRRTERSEPVMDLPAAEWLQLDLCGAFGPDAPPGWSLTVSVPGAEPRVFAGLPWLSPAFSQLTWAGFSSHGEPGSATFLDDYHLEQLPAGRDRATTP